MARLLLSFLGPTQVTLDGQPVTTFESARVRALLAYLAVEAGRAHPRETLTGLLWPGFAPSSALTDLRRALANLRTCIGDREAKPPYLSITREAIRWNPDSDYELDVATLGEGLRGAAVGGDAAEPGAIARLASYVPLYRGPFLEGLVVRDSPAFEAWQRDQREHLEQQFLALLQQLGHRCEEAGDYGQAQRSAERQLAIDPYREEAQRRLMRILALGGDRNAALARYQAFRAALAEELGVEPDPETTALCEQIRGGALIAPSRVPRGPILESSAVPDVFAPIAESPCHRVSESSPPLFVAREQELAQLERWLGEALSGQGRVGLVVGEPGSGKSTLLGEFARRAMEALRLLSGDVEGQRTAGALSREHARRLQGLTPHTLRAVLESGPALINVLLPGVSLLERARTLPDAGTWVARVQEALGLRVTAPAQASLLDHVTRVLQRLAQQQPLIVILDDLQWADAASISLLFHLGRRVAGHRLLILGAYRPEEVAAGREGQPHPLQPVVRELQRTTGKMQVDLDQAEGQAFLDALLDSEPNRLGAEFRAALNRRTGGQALFSVELLRGLQERGDLVRDAQGLWTEGPSLDWDRLPERVEAAIAERIERLPRQEQEILTVASVEGEEFHAEVAAHALRMDAEQVSAALSGPLSCEHHLVTALSMHRAGTQRFSRYRFRHYLFQHYLYQRLDRLRRAHWHGEVGSALEALGAAPSGAPDWLNTVEVLADNGADLHGGSDPLVSEATMAWHWDQAGATEKAIVWHGDALWGATYLPVLQDEILARIRRQLELLGTLPESPWRSRFEYLGYKALGSTLANLGWSAPGVEQALRQSVERAEQTGDGRLVADALYLLTQCQRMRGKLDEAQRLAERAVPLAEGGPPGWVTKVKSELGLVLLYRGNLTRSTSQLAPLSEALLGDGPLPPWASPDDFNALEHLAWAAWCLGYPDRALRISREAMEVALREQDKLAPGTEVMLLCGATCFISQLRREMGGVAEGLQRLRAKVDTGLCYPVWLPVVPFYQGWVHTVSGMLEQGIAELRQGLAGIAQDNVAEMPYLNGYLAEALGRAGLAEEGLGIVDEMLAQVERTGERWSEAELWRVKGELLLQRPLSPAQSPSSPTQSPACPAQLPSSPTQSPSSPTLLPYKTWEKGGEEAEACFRHAIEVARGQEARSWELRATTSLARLLREQGRGAEGREMLAAIYGWFTEGFDTPDLVEAKRLLEELGG